jgi:PAS domain S-box-containing protein
MEKSELKSVVNKEDDLNDTIATYRMLLAASGIGAWEYFVGSNELLCNDIYFSMLGIQASGNDAALKQDLRQAWSDLLHPDDVETASVRFQQFIEKRGSENYDSIFRLRHHDGTWRWIWSQGRFVNAGDKGAVRVIGTHIDVTRQKLSEQRNIEERAMLRTLIDNLPDTIYIKDMQAKKLIANLADVHSIGADSEKDVLGKTDIELFKDNEIAQRGYQDDLSVLKTGIPIINKEEYFTDKDGNTNWLLTSKIPVIDEEKRVVKMIGIGHNITHRKLHDEAVLSLNKELKQQAADLLFLNEQLTLRKEQELEKALALGKFEIASEVLHDIGNALVGFGAHLNKVNRSIEQLSNDPLQGLTTFLSSHSGQLETAIGNQKSSALIGLSNRILSTQQHNKAEISSAIKEIFNIIAHIQEILNIQRQFVRSQEGLHERKPVNMKAVLDDCKSMIYSAISRRGIELNTEIKPGEYLFKGDHTRIMQVLLNILKNASEAIKSDSDEKFISISLQAEDNQLVLIIKDSGVGFDQATGNHLCERGFTTKANGTGLGLYNCRSIVESHQGQFLVSSDGRGKGAVVHLRLPLFLKV